MQTETALTLTALSSLTSPRRAKGVCATGSIDQLIHQRRPHRAKKLAGSRNEWRVRVGDYRVLYEMDDATRRVVVYAVGHRREVYR